MLKWNKSLKFSGMSENFGSDHVVFVPTYAQLDIVVDIFLFFSENFEGEQIGLLEAFKGPGGFRKLQEALVLSYDQKTTQNLTAKKITTI